MIITLFNKLKMITGMINHNNNRNDNIMINYHYKYIRR